MTYTLDNFFLILAQIKVGSMKILLTMLFFCSAIYAQELKREFYPNGRLKSEGYFENGIKNGVYKEYHQNGKLWKEWFFK
ncbi:MAG: hypothetical protein GYA14_06900, partial [Ignavibacteria bacterium]|nr:hypothetical protein [Ignavibacteria bacterium]